MDLVSRFFGKREKETRNSDLVANPQIENPLSLQVLFAEKMTFRDTEVAQALQSFHESMSSATCEHDQEAGKDGNLIGLVGWGKHVIRLVGFDLKMPAGPVESCIAPSHYPRELKERARNHQSHLILYYAGYESAPLEQYVAMAAVAAVLSQFGAIVVLNETAHTSFPAAALAESDGDERMDLLRVVPLLLLYCGFVKYELEGIQGVWMRTHGADRLSLPDLAVHAKGHHEGQLYFDMFNTIFHYLLESGAKLGDAHTMQVGKDSFIRFRLPLEEESFLESAGTMFVVESITQDQINR